MRRWVEAEWLDELPINDAAAMGSRRDLRRLNAWMGNVELMAEVLRAIPPRALPLRLVELGAGDASFLLRLAQRLSGHWMNGRATLLDRQNLLAPETGEAFRQLGWQVDTVQMDVFDWFERDDTQACEIILANLFLHHFRADLLARLLAAVAKRARVFLAVEPRRSLCSLAFSRLVGLIGCNRVTRHDAPVSVRAGFDGSELTNLWPGNGDWTICERRAGLFSHLFFARRNERSGT